VIELRPILFIVGVLLSVLAVAMVIPAVLDASAANPDWQVFAASAAVTFFVGVASALANRSPWDRITLRQAFVMTTLAWLVIATFGALPFAFSELGLSFTDAFFESMSGITTTGSTVIVGLDFAPPGILLWRSILQWLGGIGIIVMAISVLPLLQVGGMQMFRVEAFEQSEKVLPRAAEIAGEIVVVYVVLTFAGTILLWSLGMTGFEAVAHAMSSIATGGFSTSDASVGHFNSAAVDWAVMVIMVLGGLPFVLYLRARRGDVMALVRDSQVQWFVGILAVATAIATAWLCVTHGFTVGGALRYAAFNVVSVMTGTGFSTADYGTWGGLALTLMFILMFIGGCAGSTTCGIKIFRIQVLYATARAQLLRLMQPHGIYVAYYNRRPIPDGVRESVMSFFFLFILCFGVLATALAALGLDFVTAISGAATAIANVGPGLGGVIGPAGTFASLSDPAKWFLSAGMLLGRLELFTVLVLLAPSFWRG
jgi:trk system potassium uptake protein TrkH